MNKPCLPTETVEPTVDASASVIWMHGLGADGHDFVPITQRYQLLLNSGVRFVFPHAPKRAVTVNQGMHMPAWFDIYDLEFRSKEDNVGIVDSQKQIQALILQERARGIPFERIVLAGFSQGGAMALHSGLHFAEMLGGIVALSAYLPLSNKFEKNRSMQNHKIPILMLHGLFDPVVPLALGEKSKKQLLLLDYPLTWKTYFIQHTVIPEEIQMVGDFLTRILA